MKFIGSNAELRQLHSAGEGLIFNDFSGKGPGGKDYNVLHAASCNWVARSNVNVHKYFFSNLDEAIKWLQKNRGEEGESWKRCGTCQASALVQPRAGPVTEEIVKKILIQYLKDRGYKVRQQVLVAGGKVDVSAEGQGGHWLIEVKGEDKGGYTSAEMNFQIGIGQIVSRMTDPDSNYALAFPMTHDFKRVLRKYKGSLGFERLNLQFFVIHQDGKVDEHDATAMKTLIGNLQRWRGAFPRFFCTLRCWSSIPLFGCIRWRCGLSGSCQARR